MATGRGGARGLAGVPGRLAARGLLATTTVLILLSGCAGVPGDGTPATSASPAPLSPAEDGPRPLFPLSSAEVLEYCPATPATHFDGDAAAVDEIRVCVSTVLLSTDDRSSDDSTTDDSTTGALPAIERASRVVTGGEELLAAYAVPDSTETAEVCAAMLADPLIVWLVTGDRVVPVYAPFDDCNFPQRAAADAYTAVTLETLVEVRGDSPNDPPVETPQD